MTLLHCVSIQTEKKIMAVVFKNLVTLLRHAEVMKKIIETVAEGGGELGVHMYPFHRLVFGDLEEKNGDMKCLHFRSWHIFTAPSEFASELQ